MTPDRERELLEANNRYLERARTAEKRLCRLEGNIEERLARLEAQAHPPVEIEPIVRSIVSDLVAEGRADGGANIVTTHTNIAGQT